MTAEFVAAESTAQDLVPRVTKALRADSVGSHRERRIWYDTFDWRLHGAGLVLEMRTRGRDRWTVLSDRSGRVIAQSPSSGKDLDVAALPAGEIRDRVTRLLDIRSALPVASGDGPVRVLRVLDGQQKTVARVIVDGPVTISGADTTLPARFRVEALRGYEKQARTTATRLTAIKGLRAADRPLFDAAVVAAGQHPGGYRSKPDAVFDPGMRADAAYATVLDKLWATVLANVDGTLRQLDTEFLHDLRVSVRRSRSALKAGKQVLEEGQRLYFAGEFRWLGDVTTPSRDLDVYVLGFDDMVAAVGDATALEPFRELLGKHCRRAHASLNRALRSQRFASLAHDWQDYLATLPIDAPEAGAPVAEVAHQQLAKSWHRVHKRGRAIDEDSPADAVHDLRKRAKELRYLLEFFASLYDKGVHKTLVGELKQLQQNLGDFQDAESQRLTVGEYAEELAQARVPAATVMAMGRLDDHLHKQLAAARAQFAARWVRFDRPKTHEMFQQMIAGGSR